MLKDELSDTVVSASSELMKVVMWSSAPEVWVFIQTVPSGVLSQQSIVGVFALIAGAVSEYDTSRSEMYSCDVPTRKYR